MSTGSETAADTASSQETSYELVSRICCTICTNGRLASNESSYAEVTAQNRDERDHDLENVESSQLSQKSVEVGDIILGDESNKPLYTRGGKESKARSGVVSERVGCLCEVLSTFDIQPSCVFPPRTPKSRSLKKGLKCFALASTPVEKVGFCSESSSSEDPEASTEGNEETRCCSRGTCTKLNSRITTISGGSNCSQKTCCSAVGSKPSRRGAIREARSFSKTRRYRSLRNAEFTGDQAFDYSGSDSRNGGTSTPPWAISILEEDEGNPSEDSCSNESFTNFTVSPAGFSTTGIYNADVEKGATFQIEHLVINIQGMTCVGCEKKVARSLESLPGITNVKTSLVLAQAEFDLEPSSSVDGGNIIETLERMTGFTCAKVTHLGSFLDLTVDRNAQALAGIDLPIGVTDLTVLNKTTIRVAYHPRIVGARELLADPIFHKAKLAPVAPSPAIASGRSHVRKMFFMTLLSALLTIPVLVLAWAPLPANPILYGGISLGLATIVQTVIAAPFYSNAAKALIFSRMIEMDLLIVLSTSTAFTYSVFAYGYLVAGQPLSTPQFFETSTLLVTLIMAGRCISTYARQRAIESISVESLQTPTALLIDEESRREQEIDARLLQYQDNFKVLPDTAIVTDGIVVTGETEVDESMITGETRLVTKKPGTPVVAGSINHSGTLVVRLTRLPCENTIKTIGSMVDEAKSSKPKIQKIADRVASIFVPIILVLTVGIFATWIVVGINGRHQSATNASIVAMTYAISALIISCPCAIGLAVPMVVAIAGGVAAQRGLIFKSAETIEIARKVSHVIFDKTGTLTQGKLSVAAANYPTNQSDLLGPIILGLTAGNKHPVSVSIAAHITASGFQASPVKNVVSISGSGIEATWDGKEICAGNPYWLGVEGSSHVREILLQGLTVFCVTMDKELVAVFGLRDFLRPDAVEVVDQLKRRSVEVSIVSGDNEKAVQSLARNLDIPQTHIRSGCTPGDKQAYVKEMLKSKKSVVMFCGDGTNDAIALAQASIGVHMNEGTDIARSAADVVLMRPSLRGCLILIDLSKAFHRRVVFNFLWSFAYNVFAILLAAGAFPNARISPQFAGLGEIVSVLPVIAIAMQLRWFRS